MPGPQELEAPNTGGPGGGNPALCGIRLRRSVPWVRTSNPSQKGTLNDIIDNQVIGKFTKQGKASGETIKEIEERRYAQKRKNTKAGPTRIASYLRRYTNCARI